MVSSYDDVFDRLLRDPEGFWSEAAQEIDWIEPWSQVIDVSNPPFNRWFVGGVLNTCYNAVDLHVETGRADQAALIYDSPVTDTVKTYTYRELRDEIAAFAGALASHGVSKGDRVIIYMPMVPEAVIAMLACARLGAVHSVVFGGFAANELAVRIDDSEPKVIVSASCGVEVNRVVPYKPLLDGAIELARHKPGACIILQRPTEECVLIPGQDVDWKEAVDAAEPHDCVPVAATDPLYILYTSGTTGEPKGVVRDNGGHAVSLKWSMKNIYDVEPGEVYWAASDVGWVVGHSYIVYAPLLNGNTTVLFEGKPVGTPDAGAFWRVISQHNVEVLFTAPTAFRAIKKEDPEGALIKDYDLSRLKALFLAGERLDPDTLQWAVKYLGIPVIDHWWQTETGWSICANCLGIGQLPIKRGLANKSCARHGCARRRRFLPRGQARRNWCIGHQVAAAARNIPNTVECRRALHRVVFSEFPGYYKTADAGFIDEDDYVFVISRTDDIINVAGHRLSTGAMEEILAAHPDVAECAVIGVADQLKGQLPLGFLVLSTGIDRDHAEIVTEVVQMVHERIGPVAAFKTATVVQRLPKTRSGKILRGTMQKIADGEEFKVPATIDDPAIVTEIAAALKEIGYPN